MTPRNRQKEKLSTRLKREIHVWRCVAKHPRTPRISKILLGAALAYIALPFDLIPDFIPVLGVLDDVIIVPGLIWLAVRFIPRDVVQECRARAKPRQEIAHAGSIRRRHRRLHEVRTAAPTRRNRSTIWHRVVAVRRSLRKDQRRTPHTLPARPRQVARP
ncbi:DUF1232 domain-containing protein [bacterium]|nr:DUF1232 domain-containing protein [bacterium]